MLHLNTMSRFLWPCLRLSIPLDPSVGPRCFVRLMDMHFSASPIGGSPESSRNLLAVSLVFFCLFRFGTTHTLSQTDRQTDTVETHDICLPQRLRALFLLGFAAPVGLAGSAAVDVGVSCCAVRGRCVVLGKAKNANDPRPAGTLRLSVAVATVSCAFR